MTYPDERDVMIEVARRKSAKLGLDNIDFIAGDVTRLSFEDESFNAVLSRFCLMFMPDIPATLA